MRGEKGKKVHLLRTVYSQITKEGEMLQWVYLHGDALLWCFWVQLVNGFLNNIETGCRFEKIIPLMLFK